MGLRAGTVIAGLLGFLNLLVQPPPARADGLLRLYVFPSPSGIDWSSPGALARSTLLNELTPSHHERRHSIGHVNVELRCPIAGGGARKILTGMTTASGGSSSEFQALFGDKIGLGVLFRSFPGRLESPDEVRAQLPGRWKRGDISLLEYPISDAACERLMLFHDHYEQEGMAANYGLPNRPRHGEGGGCSAYAITYLELAGILTPEMRDRWSRTIRVPVDLIGGREADTPPRRVSFFRILFSFWRGLAKSGEEFREVRFWDPDAMHQWVREVFLSSRTDYQRISLDESLGLIRDERTTPVPAEPIFLP